MMQTQRTESSQFSLAGGIRRTTSDFVLIPSSDDDRRATGRKGRLWICTESATRSIGAGAAAKMVIEEIEDEYYQSSASSIPTALEDAVRAGNKVLVEYNAAHPRRGRRT
ncbi:MAG: hypothetical protein WKH64_04735 [Chloroflexia bacterium]